MARLIEKRNLLVLVTLVAVLAALGVGQSILERAAAQANTVQAPRFEVDPMWPKPMPNNWVLGQTIGLTVDDRDHVWLIHRGNDPGTAGLDRTELALPQAGAPRVSECCEAAPPVLEFDAEGNLVGHWGGPVKGAPYTWPESNHGVVIDHKGFVWIGGNGPNDAHILKFTRDGKFVAQYGKAGARRDPNSPADKPNFVANSKDMDNFGRVAKMFIDPKANEGYVADGYLNHRVAVIDLDNGKIKRMWGAYGEVPTDDNLGRYDPSAPPAKQFRNPVHCAEVAVDGMVYVCDRPNDRIQVFTKEGKFVKEYFHEKQTLSDGSVWDIAFSKDPEQKYMYVADGANEHIWVFDRKAMTLLTQFGYGGRQPGMFLGVHSIATDSKGNIYTTETYTGKRLQKFAFKGVGAVPKVQGVPWPKGTTTSSR
jgi:DNA-binding beta-propeller fold protein YncE